MPESNYLPNESFFHGLLHFTAQNPHRIIIRDPEAGLEASWLQFWADVLQTRSQLLSQLSAWAKEIQQYAAQHNQEVTVIPIQSQTPAPLSLSALNLQIHELSTVPASQPGIIFFSSGSTGIPKGVVHARRFLYDLPRADPDECALLHRPLYWAGGSMVFIKAILRDQAVQVIDTAASMAAYWEVLRQGRVTAILSTVLLWDGLAAYYRDHISHLPDEKRDEYRRGVRRLRNPEIGGYTPLPELLRFWRDEIGKELVVIYASSETGGIVLSSRDGYDVNMERYIGMSVPGREVILSRGDHGEILVRGKMTFIGYLNDEISREDLFTHDGYYKTGDIAHRKGDHFFFDGRASMDFIKTIASPVPIVYLENQISKLPHIQEAYVVPVYDARIGNRVGVLARVSAPNYDLQTLRDALAEAQVASHMLPTVLRLLSDEEKVPMTDSAKIAKMKLLELYFPKSGGMPGKTKL
ncbi:hypothetical protein MW887_008042 [Aspergillus wentii]|nr:hypothetical protein MW887_008042 [Aspergillus wentii]